MGRSRPFRWLTPAERSLWAAYPSGAWVDLREEGDDPAEGASWGRARTVRAEVIAALLLGLRDDEPGRVAGVRLAGARIAGDLNLSDATIEAKIHLLDCHLSGVVSLNDTRTRGVRLRGCDVLSFAARRATVDGLLDLDGSTIRSGLYLDNAHITGQFRLTHAQLNPTTSVPWRPGPDPQSAGDPAQPSSGPDAPDDWREPRSRGPVAMWAGGLTVDGGAFLRDLRATGCLRLVGARFNSGVHLQRAVIVSAGTHAVQADHMEATAAEFSDGFTAHGTVRLRGARISGVLSFDEAVLTAPDRALHLSHMRVEELILLWSSIEGEVNLGYSRIGVLFDRIGAYPGHVHLNGLTYASLRGPAPVAERLSWLRRDPDGYRPQPYEELAAYYRRIGHDAEGRRVLLAKQRARRRTLRLPGRLWGGLLDVLVGYGYRPWLAGVWVALLLAVGTSVFSHWRPHQIGLDESRHFDAFTYTLDLLVPVSVFEQRAAWEPVGWTQWLANGLIAAGWILATALIAAGTRVLRASGAQ
ncbi:hypothetical protein [Microbispora sp. ATCC PTA-5024]|uniref:hypothetical protein n=1 Tax=Microbispora sp. ATCC PTA-5024 TaxID=316330 RepID=UPI0003DBAA44|nr:hypothetical protein [Microbispora sp. ATCC PTA-5024]ETK32738.1 membrane-associated oxidoreductase [Microbispora sp. ATCC PTA-5024]